VRRLRSWLSEMVALAIGRGGNGLDGSSQRFRKRSV
jgi:hypothetical protein